VLELTVAFLIVLVALGVMLAAAAETSGAMWVVGHAVMVT
jgi:hypothetical protein